MKKNKFSLALYILYHVLIIGMFLILKMIELKKIVLNLKSIEQPITQLFDEVQYRIFVKEGRTNVIVYDWTKTDVTNENSFFLDTSYLIPREYYMEFKAKTYTEEIFYDEYVKFEVLSEK
jgi:hypothetical protein